MNEIDTVKTTNKFTWGEPINTYTVDSYEILKYHPWKVTKGQVHQHPDRSKVSFHGWIDGKDIHESWPTLETCIAGMIGRKYGGLNCNVGYYFCKMIDAPPYNKKEKEEIK